MDMEATPHGRLGRRLGRSSASPGASGASGAAGPPVSQVPQPALPTSPSWRRSGIPLDHGIVIWLVVYLCIIYGESMNLAGGLEPTPLKKIRVRQLG